MCKLDETAAAFFKSGITKLGVGAIGFVGCFFLYSDFRNFLEAATQYQVQQTEILRVIDIRLQHLEQKMSR